MQNREEWKPSKFVYKNGKLVASRDPAEVSLSSRLIADIVADFYGRNLKQHARGRLLDLGCGKVPLYATYRELVTDAICVDWGNTLHKNRHLDRGLDLTGNLPFDDTSLTQLFFRTFSSTSRCRNISGKKWLEFFRKTEK